MPIYDALLMQDGLHLPHPSGHPLRQVRDGGGDDPRAHDAAAETGRWKRHGASSRERRRVAPAYPLLDDEGRLVGMLDAAEISRALEAGEVGRKLVELDRRPSVHAHPDHALDTVLVKLGRLGVSELPVVSRKDPRKLLGVISMRDVAAALARSAGSEAARRPQNPRGPAGSPAHGARSRTRRSASSGPRRYAARPLAALPR